MTVYLYKCYTLLRCWEQIHKKRVGCYSYEKKNESNALLTSLVQDLTLQEAETIALSILKQVMEEKVGCPELLHIPFSSVGGHQDMWSYCLILNRWPQTMLILPRSPPSTTCTPPPRSKPSLQGCETLPDSCASHHQSVIDSHCTKRGHVIQASA